MLSSGSQNHLIRRLRDDKLTESILDQGKVVYRVTSSRKEKFGKAVAAYNFSIRKLSHCTKTLGEALPMLIQETEENTIVNTGFDK